MPQPYRSIPVVLEQTLDITQAPECAAGMMAVINRWACIEASLVELFAAATGQARSPKPGHISRSPNKVAAASLGAIENLHTRLAVVTAAWEATSVPKRFRDRFELLKPRLRKAVGNRNLIAHSQWVTDLGRKEKDRLICLKNKLYYTAVDFARIASELKALDHEILNMAHECEAHLAGLPPPKPFTEPRPILVGAWSKRPDRIAARSKAAQPKSGWKEKP